MNEGSLKPNLIAAFAVRNSRRSDLNGIDAAVLFSIALRFGPEGQCFSSYETIAADAKISRSAAAESIDYLRRLGILSVLDGVNGRTGNTYEINVQALSSLSEDIPRRTRATKPSATRTPAERSPVRLADVTVRHADALVRHADGANESATRTLTSPPRGREEDTQEDKNTINARTATPSDPAPTTARSGPKEPPSPSSCSVVQVSLFEAELPPAEPNASSPKEKRTRRKPETALSDKWSPSPDNVRWAIGRAAEHKIVWEISYIGLLTEQFQTKAGSIDRRARNWIQAWQNWILIAIEREVKFRANKQPPAQGSPAFRPRETGAQPAGYGGDGWREGISDAERQRLKTEAEKRDVRL